MNLEEYLDTDVILYGIAENSMGGAVVVCGPDSHAFVEGLEQWDESDVLKAVRVAGLLAREGDDADIQVDDDNAVHGMGSHYVVKDASWRVVS